MDARAVFCCCAGTALFFGTGFFQPGHAQRAQAPPQPEGFINFPILVTSAGDAGNSSRNPDACDDGTGHCTLRGAIQVANIQSGADHISFSLPAGSVINLGSALPNIAGSLTINGPGPDKLTVRRNSGGNYRIFRVTSGTGTFSGLTIRDGASTDDGGAINGSSISVTNCAFIGNVAYNGGGLYQFGGTGTVTNCTFTGNHANANGGGIAIDFYGQLTVTGCTFTGNTASNNSDTDTGGGGLGCGNYSRSQAGFLTISNSTFTENWAYRGGAIQATHLSVANVNNCTIVRNGGLFAGGITSRNSQTNVKSTIVAMSNGGPFVPNRTDVSGEFVSGGFNLIGATDSSTGFTAVTDQRGTLAARLDPKIDPAGLQNNGGPTQTIALRLGSPAIDKGTSAGLTSDQRSSPFPRTADYDNVNNASGGDGTDIGAFEGTVLKITSIARGMNQHIVITGQGIPNRAHTMQVSPDLTPNSFTALPNPVTVTGTGTFQVDHDSAAGLTKQFYRLTFP